MVGGGEEFADGGEAGAAVGLADHFVGDEAVFIRPDGPDAGDRGRGVYQDAVEIEEHTSALNFHRSMIPSFDAGLCVLAPRNARVTCKWEKRQQAAALEKLSCSIRT